jgi:hypothetical protein
MMRTARETRFTGCYPGGIDGVTSCGLCDGVGCEPGGRCVRVVEDVTYDAHGTAVAWETISRTRMAPKACSGCGEEPDYCTCDDY